MHKASILVFLCFLNVLKAQKTLYDCNEAVEFKVAAKKITYSLSNKEELHKDVNHSDVIPFRDYKKRSFWYKLVFEEDCELSFNIYPNSEEDVYNFFLYRSPANGRLCDSVTMTNYPPVRANLFRKKIKQTGTGLAPNAIIGFSDSLGLTKELLFNQPHHNSIKTHKGEVYYLNIYHTKGSDCGHHFELIAGEEFRYFKILHDQCLNEPLMKIVEKKKDDIIAIDQVPKKIIQEVKPVLSVKEKKFTPILVYGEVSDSLTKEPLPSKISCVNIFTGAKFFMNVEKGKNYNLVLNEPGDYRIFCQSPGYKQDTFMLKFSGDEDRPSMQADFKLMEFKKGDVFTLRNIYFYPNTYAFVQQSESGLEEIFQFMKAKPGAVIEVQGHTNGRAKVKSNPAYSTRGEEWNFSGNEKQLSKLRAEAVKKYLSSKGVTDERVNTIGYGAEKMIYPNPMTKAENDMNMRVEIRIISMGENIQ